MGATNSIIRKPIISADSHIMEPPGTYVDRIDRKLQAKAPQDRAEHRAWRHLRDRRAWKTRSRWAWSQPRASRPRSSPAFGGTRSSTICIRGGWDPEGPSRGSGPRRRQRRDHLPDRRHGALQPPRRRLQEGLLRRLQPVDRRVLRRAARAPARLRTDRDAHARGGHRGPAGDQGARAARRDDARLSGPRGLRQPDLRRRSGRRPSSSACRSRSTSSRREHQGRRRPRPRARAEAERLHDHHPRLPGRDGHAHLRRRVRAPSEAEGRLRRGRRRLGAALHVPHGPRVRAPPLLADRRPRSRRCRASTSARTST